MASPARATVSGSLQAAAVTLMVSPTVLGSLANQVRFAELPWTAAEPELSVSQAGQLQCVPTELELPAAILKTSDHDDDLGRACDQSAATGRPPQPPTNSDLRPDSEPYLGLCAASTASQMDDPPHSLLRDLCLPCLQMDDAHLVMKIRKSPQHASPQLDFVFP